MQKYTEGDLEAKHILIERNLRLVAHIVKKYQSSPEDTEDMLSIGTIGLIKAINTFKPDKNIKLATYASRCIENEILMYLRRTSKTKMEVSINEPLNVDWDGNELLLSDILGTEEDTISRDIENEVERKLLGRAINCLSPRERTIVMMRFGLDSPDGRENAKGSSRYFGNFTILYFKIGEKDYAETEKRDGAFRIKWWYNKTKRG